MRFPQNITKEHILKALKRIDSEGIPSGAKSKQYDLQYENKSYPPKLVISYANVYPNESELDRDSFEGGEGTACFKLLRKHGFVIEPKNISEFYPILLEFLEQATSSIVNLKVSSYPRIYKDLKLKVSFGQGGLARIPWVAFLRDSQSVSNGIYPVYLYFSEYRILVLAYGISETNVPEVTWNINAKTVFDLIEGEYFKEVKRYGNSLVYKYYDIDLEEENFGLKKKSINKDIDDIIDLYKKVELNKSMGKTERLKKTTFNYKDFRTAADLANLKFSEQLVIRYCSSLCTKPFVILTGLSGSGKTKLAQAFAMWICEDEAQYCILPVGADWTNREPLLGFPNALRLEEYVKPDNKVLDLILDAIKNSDKPYFLILDEMNLSHVERYFADFLSVMETKKAIRLHSGKNIWNGIPHEITLPQNLFIVGTVNIDETTYMFSPKVLDRANVIEFRVKSEEMEAYLKNYKTLTLNSLEGKGSNTALQFLGLAYKEEIIPIASRQLNDTLNIFFKELKKAGAEFGYRSASEILRFASIVNETKAGWSINEIIDVAILQKLLPKVHGSRRKLEPILKTLAELCLKDTKDIGEFIPIKPEIDLSDPRINHPLSLEKILRMYESLLSNGFASYAEA